MKPTSKTGSNNDVKVTQTESVPTVTTRDKWIFISLMLTKIFANFDNGGIPAANSKIQAELGLTASELGLLGSLVYIGFVLGSFVSAKAFQKFPTKYLIVGDLILFGLSMLMFALGQNLWMLVLARIFAGFFQVFLAVFMPVWCDMHGKNKKSMFMTLLNLGLLLGFFIGYLGTAGSITYLGSWRYGFYLQPIALTPIALCLAMVPAEDMDISGRNQKASSIKEKALSKTNLASVTQSQTQSRLRKTTVTAPINMSTKQQILTILRNKFFIFTCLILCAVFFIVTGIQFWVSDYLSSVLGVAESDIYTIYSVIQITGPTAGVVFGGLTVALCIPGGYENPKAMSFCIFLGIAAACVAIPMGFISEAITFFVLLWLLLFFGGALLAPVMGAMINSVDIKQKSLANSIAILFQNALGNFPSPYVFGLMSDHVSQRAAMKLLTCWSIFGVIFGICAKMVQKKKKVDQIKNPFFSQLNQSTLLANQNNLSLLGTKEGHFKHSMYALSQVYGSSTMNVPEMDVDDEQQFIEGNQQIGQSEAVINISPNKGTSHYEITSKNKNPQGPVKPSMVKSSLEYRDDVTL